MDRKIILGLVHGSFFCIPNAYHWLARDVLTCSKRWKQSKRAKIDCCCWYNTKLINNIDSIRIPKSKQQYPKEYMCNCAFFGIIWRDSGA